MYIRLSFILSEVLMKGFLYQRDQLHLLEQLPLSLCTYPPFLFSFKSLFSKKRIWLRIAHFY